MRCVRHNEARNHDLQNKFLSPFKMAKTVSLTLLDKISKNTGRESKLILALLVVFYAKENCWDDAQKVGDD